MPPVALSPRTSLKLLIVAIALTLTAPLPASASEVERFKDKVGDAKARADITSVTYERKPNDRLEFVLDVRDLGPRGKFVMTFGYARTDYYRIQVTRSGKKAEVEFEHAAIDYGGGGAIDFEPRACGVSASWQPRRDRVAMTVPKRCKAYVYDISGIMRAHGSRDKFSGFTDDFS